MKRLLIIFFLFISSCATPSSTPTQALAPTAVAASPVPSTPALAQPKEQVVAILPLSGDLQNSKAEISGLTWYKDYLIVMPQYPNFAGAAGDGRLFAISKADIVAFLDGKSTAPLNAKVIPFFASGITGKVKGYQGFEAIVFKDDRVYMAIEAESGGMMGYLVSGTIKPDLSEVRLDADVLIEMKPQANVNNASNESLMLMADRLISFYEGNGANLNPKPVGYVFGLPSLEPLPPISFLNIEYRITDATAADANGKFWAINYFFPGEREKYKTGEDPLAKKFGKGATHAKQPHVERLVEFQYTPSGIVLTDMPPIQLLLEGSDARNWEGIVRLDARGFLLATDQYPKTLLGFVAFP